MVCIFDKGDRLVLILLQKVCMLEPVKMLAKLNM